MHYLAGTKPDVHGPGFGYTCLRSSGSKGAVDVVAVARAVDWSTAPHWMDEEDGDIWPPLFIQCKITNPVIPPAERHAVQDLAFRAGAVPLVAYWAKHETTGLKAVHFRRLTGPLAKDWLPWEPKEEEN
jgi:hypothetical protein